MTVVTSPSDAAEKTIMGSVDDLARMSRYISIPVWRFPLIPDACMDVGRSMIRSSTSRSHFSKSARRATASSADVKRVTSWPRERRLSTTTSIAKSSSTSEIVANEVSVLFPAFSSPRPFCSNTHRSDCEPGICRDTASMNAALVPPACWWQSLVRVVDDVYGRARESYKLQHYTDPPMLSRMRHFSIHAMWRF